MLQNSTERFGNRTEDYVKYRPRYPSEVIDVLRREYSLRPEQVVVDVGSGTGISTELFLRAGHEVYAVEPNGPMRAAAEEWLGRNPRFHSMNGRAEATGLPDHSADLIVAAQAFHWFDPGPTREEFRRVLRPGGRLIILVNDRALTGSRFAEQYEALLVKFGIDYHDVKQANLGLQRHREFLGPHREFHFPNPQEFDFQGLLGRLKSASYIPKEDHPRFGEMVAELREIFRENQSGRRVTMEQTARLFVADAQR